MRHRRIVPSVLGMVLVVSGCGPAWPDAAEQEAMDRSFHDTVSAVPGITSVDEAHYDHGDWPGNRPTIRVEATCSACTTGQLTGVLVHVAQACATQRIDAKYGEYAVTAVVKNGTSHVNMYDLGFTYSATPAEILERYPV